MKRVLLALLALALVACVLQLSAQGPARPGIAAGRTQWEYKILSGEEIWKMAPDGKLENWRDAFPKLGDDGWELVTIVDAGDVRWHYFKRVKQ